MIIPTNIHPHEAIKIQGNAFREAVEKAPTVDAVEVVLCKDCRWSKPYERTDGQTGYYCYFCGHAFKYGTNWERLFTPIKEADDFCSYGEMKEYTTSPD